MRTLVYLLVFASLLMTVPSFMAIAQDTTQEKMDDMWVDENSPVDDEEEYTGEEQEETNAVSPNPNEGAKQPEPAQTEPAQQQPENENPHAMKPAEKVEKKVAAPAKTEKRQTASAGGFRTTKADCPMHADAADGSAVLTTIKGAKKIWTEKHGDGWVKTFRKTGHGYMSESCFE